MAICEGLGDNLEFSVENAGDEVTITLNSSNTSANDTATQKYADSAVRAIKYHLRNSQAIEILEYNGTALTDPISIPKNKGHKEEFGIPILISIKIRVSTANTNIKLRYVGSQL